MVVYGNLYVVLFIFRSALRLRIQPRKILQEDSRRISVRTKRLLLAENGWKSRRDKDFLRNGKERRRGYIGLLHYYFEWETCKPVNGIDRLYTKQTIVIERCNMPL